MTIKPGHHHLLSLFCPALGHCHTTAPCIPRQHLYSNWLLPREAEKKSEYASMKSLVHLPNKKNDLPVLGLIWNRKLKLTWGNNELGPSSKCGFCVSLVGTLVPASTKMWAGLCNACWQPGQQTGQSRG